MFVRCYSAFQEVHRGPQLPFDSEPRSSLDTSATGRGSWQAGPPPPGVCLGRCKHMHMPSYEAIYGHEYHIGPARISPLNAHWVKALLLLHGDVLSPSDDHI